MYWLRQEGPCALPVRGCMPPHHTEPPVNGFIFTGQLSLWGRVAVTAGLSSMLHEGQPHRWGLIKQQSLERHWSVSHPVLYPSEECLVSWIQGHICCSKRRQCPRASSSRYANTSKCPWWDLLLGWDRIFFSTHLQLKVHWKKVQDNSRIRKQKLPPWSSHTPLKDNDLSKARIFSVLTSSLRWETSRHGLPLQ